MKCKCIQPDWEIVHKQQINSGKNFGKMQYTLYCYKCSAMWKTTADYATKLEEKVNDKYNN